MSIKIIKPGIFTTIQDLGRANFLDHAVPISGVMDKVSARIANLLVGNTEDAALLEIVDGNFEFIVQENLLIALVSGPADFKINNQETPINRPIFVPNGAVIQLINNRNGRYSYLAVAGGWDVPEVLGSKSTFVTAAFGGYHGRLLQKDDVLFSTCRLSKQNQILVEKLKGETVNYVKWSIPAIQFLSSSKSVVRVILGTEIDWFEDLAIADFFTNSYQLSQGNRMGYHLEGSKIIRKKAHQSELLSTAVVPGTIQVTGDGSLILLMADCQTTGGYPRIAKVAEVDLPICAQLKPGNAIHFEVFSLKEAEKLYLELEKDFQKLATAIQFKIEL